MVTWIWVLIPLAAIIGKMVLEYQKNNMQMMNRSQKNESNVDELRKLVNSLKNRIENLEAIAAGEPDDFKMGAGTGMKEIEIEESDPQEENRKKVSELAEKRRTH